MCRLTLYKGKSLLIGDLIVWPDNGLLCQSRDAAFHPGIVDDSKNRRNIVVNGDGFGVCWYNDKHPERGSCCFKFVTPAWSDMNLRNIGEHVESSLIMAHIRAASSGHDPLVEEAVVSQENCHPFKYKRWTFMHNGAVPSFKSIQRALLLLLPHDIFRGITGTTDSEHIFALFLHYLPSRDEPTSVEDFIAAVEKTMSMILQLCAAANIYVPCSLNLVFSDGINVIATRFRSGKEAPPSLYYNYGSDFVCKGGHFLGRNQSRPKEIVISSAPLSRENVVGGEAAAKGAIIDSIGQWILMPRGHMLVVVGDPKRKDVSVVQDVYLRPLEIEGYNFDRHQVHLLIPPLPTATELDEPFPARTAKSFAEKIQDAFTSAGQFGCNRLRVVGSRDATPRGSFVDGFEGMAFADLKSASGPSRRWTIGVSVGTPILFFLCGLLIKSHNKSG